MTRFFHWVLCTSYHLCCNAFFAPGGRLSMHGGPNHVILRHIWLWALIWGIWYVGCHGCSSLRNLGVLGAFWRYEWHAQNDVRAKGIGPYLGEIWPNVYPQSEKYSRRLNTIVFPWSDCAHIVAYSLTMCVQNSPFRIPGTAWVRQPQGG